MSAPSEHGTPAHTFASGWNAACTGRAFEAHESVDWKDGWRAAVRIPWKQREKYLFNSEKRRPAN
jgi:hypothetical protein